MKIKQPGNKHTEASNETFNDIILEDEVKVRLKQISDDIKNKDFDPEPGYTFYGPPRNGKTLAARTLANCAGVPFFNYSAANIVSNIPSITAKTCVRFSIMQEKVLLA